MSSFQGDTVLTACSDGRVLCYDLRGGSGTESMLAGGLEVYLIAKYVRLRVLVSSLPSGCSQALHAALFNPVQQNLIATSDYEV